MKENENLPKTEIENLIPFYFLAIQTHTNIENLLLQCEN